MNIEEFREKGYEVIDYIVDYLESISQRNVVPVVQRGYFISAFPSPPETGESFENIMEDVEKYIMIGITHYQHPGYHGYFPACSSFPALLAMTMADVIGCVNFNWDNSPCGTEFETIVLDWLGKMMGLPPSFLRYGNQSRGTGVIQSTAGECVLISMITARRTVLRKLTQKNPSVTTALLLSSLVAYCSREGQSCVQKAAMICSINIKILGADEHFRLRGKTLKKAIEEDINRGLIPFFVNVTLGTRTCGACDPIDEIGPICEKYSLWLNVNAAYGGLALICPEYKHLLKGIEYASSFNVNPTKLMLVDLDCAVLFVKDRFKINDSVIIDKTDFGYTFEERDWGFPSNTELKSLKLFTVMRNYGVEGLQRHIRNHVRLAKMFEGLVKQDERFEIITCNFGIVCFRLKGSDAVNQILLKSINSTGKLYIISRCLVKTFVMRFTICGERANGNDIVYAWSIIREHADKVLQEYGKKQLNISKFICPDTCEKSVYWL